MDFDGSGLLSKKELGERARLVVDAGKHLAHKRIKDDDSVDVVLKLVLVLTVIFIFILIIIG